MQLREPEHGYTSEGGDSLVDELYFINQDDEPGRGTPCLRHVIQSAQKLRGLRDLLARPEHRRTDPVYRTVRADTLCGGYDLATGGVRAALSDPQSDPAIYLPGQGGRRKL